jgi:hypothetical protein
LPELVPLLSGLEKSVVTPLIGSLEIVITGLDPVIHAVRRVDRLGGEGVDGRIKSGHDDSRCSNMRHRPASIAAKS